MIKNGYILSISYKSNDKESSYKQKSKRARDGESLVVEFVMKNTFELSIDR